MTPDPFCHHVTLGACTELLIDTHLKVAFQSHFFRGHNSHQGFNSHSLSLPSHPHVQLMKLMLYSSQNDLQVCVSCQSKSCSPRGVFCSSPGQLRKPFWSDVSLCTTHPAQVRRKQVGEVSTYQAHPPWSGAAASQCKLGTPARPQPSAAVCTEWVFPHTSLSRKNSLYLFSNKKLFFPLSRDVTRPTKTCRSAPRLQFHLSFAVCALFTLTKRRQKKTKQKERETNQGDLLFGTRSTSSEGEYSLSPVGPREGRGERELSVTPC